MSLDKMAVSVFIIAVISIWQVDFVTPMPSENRPNSENLQKRVSGFIADPRMNENLGNFFMLANEDEKRPEQLSIVNHEGEIEKKCGFLCQRLRKIKDKSVQMLREAKSVFPRKRRDSKAGNGEKIRQRKSVRDEIDSELACNQLCKLLKVVKGKLVIQKEKRFKDAFGEENLKGQ